MADVDGISLAHAISAIDEKMHRIQDQLQELDPDDDDDAYSNLQLDYLGYMKAAHALRDAYEAEFKLCSNLTPYSKLLRE